MTNQMTDRIIGVVLFVFAVLYGLQTTRFNIPAMMDPVGPSVFPKMLALGMGGLSLFLILKPGKGAEWPSAAVGLRIVLITLSFIAYAYLMVPLGFIVATTLEMTALSLVFRGPWRMSLMAGFAFSAFLFGLFDFVLGLNLPGGLIFSFLGG